MLTETVFGSLPDGREVRLFTLANASGIRARVCEYGAILVSLETPDRNGRSADVTLGFDTLAEYVNGNGPYLGAVCGRVANRIANGRFSLDGRSFQLAVNNGPNHLHGGLKGFDKALWKGVVAPDGTSVTFSYQSRDGEEGYPGNLAVSVTYSLTAKNELSLRYEASADKATPLNLTNHAYFNLSAGQAETVREHELTLFAERYTPADGTLIPIGELRSVAGSALDFRKPAAVGARLEEASPVGYDHNFVLDNSQDGKLALAARLYDPRSGRLMECLTTEPGIQLYTGYYLAGTKGRGGRVFPNYAGLALETQHYPDSINKPNFPSCVLRPGQTYRSQTVYRFLPPVK